MRYRSAYLITLTKVNAVFCGRAEVVKALEIVTFMHVETVEADKLEQAPFWDH